MSYATVEQLRTYLKQVPSSQASDELLQAVLDRATAIIDGELGMHFGTAAAGTFTVYGDGTGYLAPPAFVAGSVTLVSSPSGVPVPDYVERDGLLVVTDGSGLIQTDAHRGSPFWGWASGVPYVVSATFGYATVPADIVEACLEIAVRIWRARDAGFSDVVGVEGSGAVGYNGALPNLVKRILDNYRESGSAGVY